MIVILLYLVKLPGMNDIYLRFHEYYIRFLLLILVMMRCVLIMIHKSSMCYGNRGHQNNDLLASWLRYYSEMRFKLFDLLLGGRLHYLSLMMRNYE